MTDDDTRSVVPAVRVTRANDRPVAADGDYVVYWMIASRRLSFNFALDRAAEWARRLGRPLVLCEALRAGYPWACDRFHQFVLDGMHEHAARLARSPVLYHPYVEPQPGHGRGLLAALAARACLVVTDDFPGFFLPRMVAAAARQLPVALEKVDGNGLLPLAAAGQTFVSAYHFRRFLQRELPAHLAHTPAESLRAALGRLPPRLAALPASLVARWPPGPRPLAELPIDHAVAPVAGVAGGETAARAELSRFLAARLAAYGERRNEPQSDATSRLSPYLHWGNLSPHELFAAVARHERWTPDRLAARATGAREGYWGMSPAAERFLDEAITWREVGYNMAARRADHDRYESLPAWALATLEKHAADSRPVLYDLARLAAGRTHVDLWNAAQGQLVGEGRIHNYLRMVWGKKVIEWSPTPRAAALALVELNNRYALDGRDPNSYSGIFWCLGRYDRPWAPERPIFGTVRYMSVDNTRRKLKVDAYIRRWAPAAADGDRAPQIALPGFA